MTNKQRDQQKFKLTFLLFNLSGAKSKAHEINDMLLTTSYDIFALVETWFDQTTLDVHMAAETDFTIHRIDRTRSAHGGVMLLVRENLKARTIKTWTSKRKI